MARNEDGQVWALYASRRLGDGRTAVPVPADFSQIPLQENTRWYDSAHPPGHWDSRGLALDLRPVDERSVTVRAGFWPIEGLKVERANGTREWYALETPFVAWMVRNVTILPGDVCIFPLGPHICALDLRTKRLDEICRGRGPVVLPARGSDGG